MLTTHADGGKVKCLYDAHLGEINLDNSRWFYHLTDVSNLISFVNGHDHAFGDSDVQWIALLAEEFVVDLDELCFIVVGEFADCQPVGEIVRGVEGDRADLFGWGLGGIGGGEFELGGESGCGVGRGGEEEENEGKKKHGWADSSTNHASSSSETRQ